MFQSNLSVLEISGTSRREFRDKILRVKVFARWQAGASKERVVKQTKMETTVRPSDHGK